MSRFTHLRKYLPFSEALSIYVKLKRRDYHNWRSSILEHPFDLRKDSPSDYFTYEEVILRKAYDIPLSPSPKTILDGGGNIGLTAAFFATRFPDASVVTLEPDAGNFELIKRNAAPYKNIHPVKAGLWHRTAHLTVKDTGQGNNAFVVEETSAETPGAVPALSIPDVMAQQQWTSIDLLKLDVEGSEKEIFSQNFESWLPKVNVLVVEMHDRMRKGCSQAVFRTISQYDFLFEIAGENVVFTNVNAARAKSR